MTIKERAQVLYDFCQCPNGKDCKECAASGVMCFVPNMRETKDAFLRETAEILMKLSENE